MDYGLTRNVRLDSPSEESEVDRPLGGQTQDVRAGGRAIIDLLAEDPRPGRRLDILVRPVFDGQCRRQRENGVVWDLDGLGCVAELERVPHASRHDRNSAGDGAVVGVGRTVAGGISLDVVAVQPADDAVEGDAGSPSGTSGPHLPLPTPRALRAPSPSGA